MDNKAELSLYRVGKDASIAPKWPAESIPIATLEKSIAASGSDLEVAVCATANIHRIDLTVAGVQPSTSVRVMNVPTGLGEADFTLSMNKP